MDDPKYLSFVGWYREGPLASYVRSIKSSGEFLDLIEAVQPAGDMSHPAVPDLVLYQDVVGRSRVSGDLGTGRFDVTSEQGGFFLAAPDFANSVSVEDEHQLLSVAFPVAKWTKLLEGSSAGASGFDYGRLHRGTFTSPVIRSALQHLWRLCDEEGVPSRLLAQAAGCEILAELYRLGGTPIMAARGGLAPWAEKRCLDLIRARLSEDVGLAELAAEARLSPFHFSRMFKQSVGLSPRAFLVRVRIERACQLLETSDLSIMEIAQEVGYTSSQVLARVFIKHRRKSPTEYRRQTQDPSRSTSHEICLLNRQPKDDARVRTGLTTLNV